ncbi:MAG: Crp/Fnr family transcriptional regulator [Anaerolineae bacterium]|jgi:CRP-like cAMP-binding protein|nr:Crp/Fnr family transcriptional regulator [Anaerolineae bacterium]
MDKDYLNLLLNISLFENISGEDIVGLLDCLQPRIRAYQKDEYIALVGDPVEGIGIVLEGRIEVLKENLLGQSVVMARFGRGSIFGEVAAFSKSGIWPSSVRVFEDANIMTIQTAHFTGQCAQGCNYHRQLMFNMLQILADKALVLNRKVDFLTVKTIRGKIAAMVYEAVLAHQSLSITLPYSRETMAKMLNVARPSLSRTLIQMKEEGILDFNRSQFTVLDEELLKMELV